jgi:hypothetical protein
MVRPIDISLNIQHAADMARASTNESQSRPELAAQQFAARLEKQVRDAQSQVNRQENAEKAGVNPDGKGHGGYAAPRKNAKKKTEAAKQQVPNSRRDGEGFLDIRV